MAARPISLLCKGLYWTLALAVGLLAAPGVDAQTKPKPKAVKAKSAKPKAAKPKPPPAAAAVEHDPLTEWELVNGAAMEARAKLKKARKPETIRQQIAELALRSAVGAESALTAGPDFLGLRLHLRTTPRVPGYEEATPRNRGMKSVLIFMLPLPVYRHILSDLMITNDTLMKREKIAYNQRGFCRMAFVPKVFESLAGGRSE